MLQATLKSSYRNKSGNVMYVYNVSGSIAEKAAYRAAKGEFNVDNEAGEPLFFLPAKDIDGDDRLIEPQLKLLITTTNKVVIDNLAAEQALMRDTKLHLAEKWADRLIAKKMGGNRPKPVISTSSQPETLSTPADLLDANNTQAEGAVSTVAEGTETIAD